MKYLRSQNIYTFIVIVTNDSLILWWQNIFHQIKDSHHRSYSPLSFRQHQKSSKLKIHFLSHLSIWLLIHSSQLSNSVSDFWTPSNSSLQGNKPEASRSCEAEPLLSFNFFCVVLFFTVKAVQANANLINTIYLFCSFVYPLFNPSGVLVFLCPLPQSWSVVFALSNNPITISCLCFCVFRHNVHQ